MLRAGAFLSFLVKNTKELGKVAFWRHRPAAMNTENKPEHAKLFALVLKLRSQYEAGRLKEYIAMCHQGVLRGPIDDSNIHLFRSYRNKVSANPSNLLHDAEQTRH